MRTFQKMHDDLNAAGHPCDYHGTLGDWLVLLGHHRDSDTIERSNFLIACERLSAIDDESYEFQREFHWAVGWVEHLLVDPSNPAAVREAEAIRAALEEYPLLDETHLGELEFDEYLDAWRDYGRSDYHSALLKRLEHYPQVSRCIEAYNLDELDALFEQARQHVNVEYEFDSGGCNINIDGLVRCTRDSDIVAAIRAARAGRIIRHVLPAGFPQPCPNQLELNL